MECLDYPTVVLVNIEKLDDWYVARSERLPGFNVAAPEFDVVATEIKPVMVAFYKEKYGAVVEVEQEAGHADEPFPIAYTAKPVACAAKPASYTASL